MITTTPKVYLVGQTKIEGPGLEQFLLDTGNEEFMNLCQGNDGIDLCAFYAKLCYNSLTVGKNKNISRVRKNIDNFKNILKTGHHSVIEHYTFNFVARDVSRIESTEQLRHRVGQAVSAESGRYCAYDEFRVWIPDYLVTRGQEYVDKFIDYMYQIERLQVDFQDFLLEGLDNFTEKKKATSCARRLKPLGVGETLGFSMNLRTIRHTIVMRTSRHAEEEIRLVFNQVADIIKKKLPFLLDDMKTEQVDGLLEYSL